MFCLPKTAWPPTWLLFAITFAIICNNEGMLKSFVSRLRGERSDHPLGTADNLAEVGS